MNFEPPADENRQEPSDEQRQAHYVVQRAIVRARAARDEAGRKARQEALEDAKAVAQVPDAE